MQKVAKLLSLILRHIVIILAAVGVLLALCVTLLALKGLVSVPSGPVKIVYGEPFEHSSTCFLSDAIYEYREIGGEWSENEPTRPGKYEIRAIGFGSFGTQKYSEPLRFDIVARPLEILPDGQFLIYGTTPSSVSATPAEGDTMSYDGFLFGDPLSTSSGFTADVWVDPDGVTLKNQYGEDVTDKEFIVTYNYGILEIKKLKLFVATKSKTEERWSGGCKTHLMPGTRDTPVGVNQ